MGGIRAPIMELIFKEKSKKRTWKKMGVGWLEIVVTLTEPYARLCTIPQC